jgi:hypothetical protein
MTRISRLVESLALGVTATALAVTLTVTGKIVVMVYAASPVYVPIAASGDAGLPGRSGRIESNKGHRRASSARPRRRAVPSTSQSSSTLDAGIPMTRTPLNDAATAQD